MERMQYPARRMGDASDLDASGDAREAEFGVSPGAAAVRPDLWSRLRSTANHPNGLTLIRIALIPLIILLFSFPPNRFMSAI